MNPEEKVNILAVDDSPDKLLALSALLSELNQNVVTATSGRDTLRSLLNQEFAVILLDINMPEMDGFETAALIRQRKNSEHTPIIFVTSYGDDTHAARGYSLGAVDYILAPVEPEVLRTKVMVFVELFKKTQQVKLQAQSLERTTRRLRKLTEASLAINSALTPDQMLREVTHLARDILEAHQAVAIAAVDQKWSAAKSAIALSAKHEALGERPVLDDRTALLSFLSRNRKTLRITRGDTETRARWPELLGNDRPVRLGWLGTPLVGRDGRNMGLLQVLEKREGEFNEEDEAILTQLAQMFAIAIENTLNAEAREANRIKDEFLTTLSHELRTPLSAILGWTRILRAGKADPGQTAHGLEVIERNVLAQAKLIDDLLDVSRIITGKLRLSIRTVPLLPVIEAAIESMRPAADAKEIRICFESRVPAGEDEVVGDPDRLQQVVWNLVSNAIKFTPPRGRVEVELARTESLFEIRVSDTGKGIAPEFLSHVFDRFRQADSTSTRTHGGLGIGLAIARHLVELHGGSITAESEGIDRGATFHVHFPAVAIGVEAPKGAPAPTAELATVLTAESPSLAGLRVLVVEDEPDGRELLVETLERAGAKVEASASAREALASLATTRPDVLVSDIGMPGEDGYSLVRKIRELPAEKGAEMPALAVSAYARDEDRVRALSAGFQEHIAKPFEPAHLVSVIARLAESSLSPRAAAASSAKAVAREPRGEGESAGTEREGASLARVLVVEDDPDSREGLRNLLEIWGHAVDVAENGSTAIEKAVQNRPGVALIDIGLPEIDGYEVAQRIREALGDHGIFLVALTGYADPSEKRRALDSGFDAHLAKPIDYATLSSLLIERLSGERGRDAGLQQSRAR